VGSRIGLRGAVTGERVGAEVIKVDRGSGLTNPMPSDWVAIGRGERGLDDNAVAKCGFGVVMLISWDDSM
jgi:hypothetical protein